MNIGSVKPGDIIRVNKKGRVYLAEVVGRIEEKGKRARLEVDPITKGVNYREAQATEVVCHWRKAGRARAAS